MKDNNLRNNTMISLRIFPTETLAFCKNNLKEEIQKEIILSWDKINPGRSEVSKTDM